MRTSAARTQISRHQLPANDLYLLRLTQLLMSDGAGGRVIACQCILSVLADDVAAWPHLSGVETQLWKTQLKELQTSCQEKVMGEAFLLTVGASLLTVKLLCLQSLKVLIRRIFPL